MIKFNSQFNYKNDNKGYQNRKPSMTVPGQSYSLAKVIERVRAGLPVQVIKSGYNPDGFPKYDDLTDIDQFKAMVKNKEANINEKIKQAKANKEANERSVKADDKS